MSLLLVGGGRPPRYYCSVTWFRVILCCYSTLLYCTLLGGPGKVLPQEPPHEGMEALSHPGSHCQRTVGDGHGVVQLVRAGAGVVGVFLRLVGCLVRCEGRLQTDSSGGR